MDDWSKQIFNAFGDAVQEFSQQLSLDTERWIEDLTDQLAQASDPLVQAADQWIDQVQEALEPEIERLVDDLNQVIQPLEISISYQVDEVAEQLDTLIEPLVARLMALDPWLDSVSAPITSVVEPILQDYPTCVGCRNFYGRTHGGNTLVCAMHPFGPDEETPCPDWEGFF
jgi:gas vesicle protein